MLVKIKLNTFTKRTILLCCTIIVLLLFFEIGLRVFYSFYSNYNTEMWRYAVESKKISLFPGLGHEHVPNKSNQLYGVEIRTNSIGLRADKEYIVPKPMGVKRILVIGDSVTVGWGVNYSDTYSQVLETLLNEDSKILFEVINIGVGNYNSASELLALKKYFYLDPDLIILGFYINDIEQINYPSKLNYFFKTHFYLSAFLLDKKINIQYGSKFDFNEYYSNLYYDELLKKNLAQNLQKMIEIANNNSIPFVFVNIPDFHQFDNYSFQFVNDFIESEVLINLDVYYINLLPVFQKQEVDPSELWVSYEDPHPNAAGQRIIAESIFEILRKNEKQQ